MCASRTNPEQTQDFPSPTSATAYSVGQSPLMTPAEVLAVTRYKRHSTLYDIIQTDGFPAPISLGPRRSNGYAGKAMWVRAEVMAWLEAKIAEPRPFGPKSQAQPA
ncbi:Prophage CP4-57 regulatory protein (AlpA) [compost metagenome]|uniref:helix-turn-helix transcriptional regulator n=1 Tax=Pseudomonas sp. JUb96 TaxID=2940539 RepID=UPI000FC3A717|nr:AlpA family phage regulatory protein [Pseudomonas sp. JUb96]MCW2267584.1 putative DNA-binding transcriptional regulator AlpA [Pseudomonas sp. JUb96]